METEGLAPICAGLGIAEEDDNGNRIGYFKDQQCLENLKDLVRFLRRDDPQTRLVFKQVCKWNTVPNNLIPMFQYCQDDRDLVLNAVKVLVFLTMPIDQSSNDVNLQLEYLWGLKSAITCTETVAVIVSLLEGPLENLECESLTEDDWKLIQLVLTLFRNILAIQDVPLMGGSACEFVSLRDRFLKLLFNENVMDLILVLTQHVDGSRGFLRHDNLLLLEVFHYIFLGQDPDLIAKARFKDSKVGSIAYADNLKSIMEVEKQKLKQCRAQNLARHSQFSGTFSRITMDGSKTVCKVNPGAVSNNLLKPHAVQRGATKKIAWDHDKFPVTDDKILELLHDFMKQFLSGSYNVLIKSIREDIEKEQIAVQKSDIIVFFQVVQFVTSFQYSTLLNSKETAKVSPQASDIHDDSTVFTGDVCGPIAESMKESMFLMVISTWRDAFDALKQTHEYKLLSAAGSVMKIMIRILDLVLKVLPENSKEPQTARILLYKLFYDQTDQGMTQFLLNLIKSFNTHKQSKSDLADLVETVHVIVRLMDILQTRGTMRVSKGSRKVRKKKPSKVQKEAGDLPSGGEATTQDKNEQLPDSICVETESQENEKSNKQDDIDNAVPAEKPDISLEMGNPDSSSPPPDNRNDHIDDDLSCSSDDDSADDQPVSNYEVDFNVSAFMKSFANHSIISNLCWLLRFYKSNSVGTNHYIITMLRRIKEDLDLAPMLYQLSLLTTFYDILNEQKASKCKEYENIVEFLTTLVRRMLRKMKNQPLLFLELLFWKSRTECQYINTDYLVHELGSLRKKTKAFNGSEENGDVGLSGAATEWAPRSIADALGDDEADVMISHDTDDKEMQENSVELQNEKASTSGSNFSRNGDKNERVPKKKRLVLTEEMEIKIKDLYEEFKDDEKCCNLIAEYLDPTGGISPTQVFNKLKQLGLKASLRKRMRNARREPDSTNAADDQPSQGEKLTEEESLQIKQSTVSRKRARAIGKDQEDKLRDLYEQFKGEKKCSHMIANALAPEGCFTAAQVSRKLKQLGLVVPRKKRSQTDDFIDDHESDDETLMSFKERRAKDARERKRSKKSTPEATTTPAGESEVPGEGTIDEIDTPANADEQMMTADDVEEDSGVDDDSHADEARGSELEDDDVDVSPADEDGKLMEDELEDDDVDDSQVVDDGDVGGSVQQMRRKSRMIIDDDDDE